MDTGFASSLRRLRRLICGRIRANDRVHAVTVQLRLIALDADDLAVISTHVQDARVQTSDIIWRQGEKRLVVGMNRLDWEQTLSGEAAPRRLIAALRFDRVLACKSRNIDLESSTRRSTLSASNFTSASSPAAARYCYLRRAARCGSTSNAWNAS